MQAAGSPNPIVRPCIAVARTRGMDRKEEKPAPIPLVVTPIPESEFLAAIENAYADDKWFSVKRHLTTLVLKDGLWYKGTRIVVPNVRAIRDTILRESHDSPLSGHVGVERMVVKVQQLYWWRGLYTDIKEYVASCDLCQRNKVPPQKPGGLLQPLAIPDRRWGSVSTDFITGLPVTQNGYDAILVFVCRLTKMVHFVATTTDVDAKEFAKLFFDTVVKLHGVPSDIVSDRGSIFTSDF